MRPHDHYLEIFALLPTSRLTVLVGGVLISGEVISADEFLTNSAMTALRTLRDEALARQGAQVTDDEREDLDVIGYLHLKDVTILNAGHTTTMNQSQLRLRLDEVTGFFS